MRDQALRLVGQLTEAYEKELPEGFQEFLLKKFLGCDEQAMRVAVEALIDTQPAFPRWSRIRECYQASRAAQPKVLTPGRSTDRPLTVEQCERRRQRMWDLVYRRYPRELLDSIWDWEYFREIRAYHEGWLEAFKTESPMRSRWDDALRAYYAALCALGKWADDLSQRNAQRAVG